MRSVKPMKAAKIGYIAVSTALCAFGLLLIIDPGFSISLLGTVIGCAMIVFGVVKLAGYFSKDLFRLAFQYDLAFGILLIVLGVIVLMKPGNLMSFICVALGISVLADGLFKIQISVDAKKFGISQWWIITALAVIACCAGLMMVFRPSESTIVLTVMLGITLISEGILNIVTVISAVKIIDHQQPDVIEGTFTEVKGE